MSLAASEADVETVNHLARQALRSVLCVPAAASPAVASNSSVAMISLEFFCSYDMLVAPCYDMLVASAM